MSKSKQRVEKPYPDFPLTWHPAGYWCKRIKGKLYYFGKDDNWEAAIAEYERVRDDLYRGIRPAPKSNEITLQYLCNAFLDAKKAQADSGEIKADTWKEYRRTCEKVVEHLGKTPLVESLKPLDFARLRECIAKTASTYTLQNEMARCRVLFAWAFDSGLIASPLAYKAKLKRPATRLLRQAKREGASTIFTRAEILRLTKKASGWMRPAIWLAINCGLGNRDVCELKWEHIDLDAGWLDFPRPKTWIERRAKLWPETCRAMTKFGERHEYVIVGQYGQPLGQGESNNTPVAHAFSTLLAECEINSDGRGFYSLRHTYRTIADGCKDQAAVRLTMGHGDHSVSDTYRDSIENERLESVAELVREWLIKKR